MSMDKRHFRSVLGKFATGVTIITTIENQHPKGITANSFTSVSLEPPLVLFCLGKESTNFQAFNVANFFAVNILSNEQTALSNRFAAYDGDRFDGVNWKNWETGAPILDGAIAAIDCIRKKLIDAGDHIIILGEVLRAEKLSEQDPLIYFNGKYAKKISY